MRFIIRDKIACWVIFRHEIEAEDADEALSIYQEYGSGHKVLEPEIGDCIEYLEQTIEIEL